MLEEVVIPAIVFFGTYHIIRLISEHLLKRKIIKAGHIDKAGIMEPPKQSEEVNRYPSLKWGLVALMSGLGFILIEILRQVNPELINDYRNATLPIGILLVFISLGFLIYFFIVNRKKM
ncbi:hypothetical protein D1164_13010 [Mariniphaga sediminis]|jgi:hypothetical protein|uniref:DUF6249 domain-containing protein n=1 Tax=Mariniphaga sediminis TaxID=1628158 RepID=A0A399D3H3_9BACT|nr:DUF6249 domain-containing protein [Mariniphaga sediminis]RIH64950.1 hypothetical protein D1164_13010 [Mariniphaga sediminis]